MLTEEKILKFYADVQALGLRFPVAYMQCGDETDIDYIEKMVFCETCYLDDTDSSLS